MEAASGVRAVSYPPISFRSYERYLGRFGSDFITAVKRAGVTFFDPNPALPPSTSSSPQQPNNKQLTPTLHPWFHGAISRSKSESLLKNKLPGSFLIRFSEAKPRSLTLAYVGSTGIRNIMIFNRSTHFSLSERGDGEDFATITEFLNRHGKLRNPVESNLWEMCGDEIETERIKALHENVKGTGSGRRHKGNYDTSSDNDTNDGSDNTGVGGDDDDDDVDRTDDDYDDGNLNGGGVHNDDDDDDDDSQGYMNLDNVDVSSTVGQPLQRENGLSVNTYISPQSNIGGNYPHNSLHNSGGNRAKPSPEQATPTNHFVTTPRPNSAKSPSIHWGHDINDIPAQKRSMQSTPVLSQDPYGSFERDAEAVGGGGNGGNKGKMQHGGGHRRVNSGGFGLGLKRESSTNENPYGSFQPRSEQPVTTQTSLHAANMGHGISRIDETYGSFGSFSAAAADGSGSGGDDAGNGGDGDFHEPYQPPLQRQQTPPPRHSSEQNDFPEVSNFIASAKTALDNSDFDVADLFLRSLHTLTQTPSFVTSPKAREYVAKINDLTTAVEKKRTSENSRELEPDVLDRAKHLAINNDLQGALELIAPFTPLDRNAGAGTEQLTAQAYRLRGDIEMTMHVKAQQLSKQQGDGAAAHRQDSDLVSEAEQAYLMGLSIAEKCLTKSREMEEVLANLYQISSVSIQSLRPLSLLESIGGVNSTSTLSYTSLVVALEGNLCKISKRKADYSRLLKRTGGMLAYTFSYSSRAEILAKLRNQNGETQEFLVACDKYCGPLVAAEALQKGLNAFAQFHGSQRGGESSVLSGGDLVTTAAKFFNKCILGARLTNDPLLEARGCGNLATCYHHMGDSARSIEYYLQSLFAFRIAAEMAQLQLQASQNGGNQQVQQAATGIQASEKKILNAFTLRLMEVGDFEKARAFCLVQLKVAVDKANLEVLKQRLGEIEKRIAGAGVGLVTTTGGEVKKLFPIPDGKPPVKNKGKLVPAWQQKVKEEDVAAKVVEENGQEEEEDEEDDEDDDDMPTGPPGGKPLFGPPTPMLTKSEIPENLSPPKISSRPAVITTNNNNSGINDINSVGGTGGMHTTNTPTAPSVWRELLKLSGHDVEVTKMPIDGVFIAAFESHFLDDDDMTLSELSAFKGDLDRNGDGVVSMAEWNKFWKKFGNSKLADMRNYLGVLVEKGRLAL
jgi:tetratricopeptide (TPR) repeat protein